MRMNNDSYFLRSRDEMEKIFGHVPGALDNTLLVAERCSVNPSTDGVHLPKFAVPDGYDNSSYLRHLCNKGVIERYGDSASESEVQDRLDMELQVIGDMNFDAYFLIVWDLCNFASEQGIWYNARGSAAGSIVAYALGITLVCPLEHGLIFERFLNPGRASMPDIDLDFQDDRRYEVLEYTSNKYGQDRVAQIITFGTDEHLGRPQMFSNTQIPGWIHGKFIFDQVNLGDVCKEIERKFDVEIDLANIDLGTITVTGVMEADNLSDVLATISLLTKRPYKFEKERYTFY